MSRCYGCCQENCGYTKCSCSCHDKLFVPALPVKEPSSINLRELIKNTIGEKVMTAGEISKSLNKNPSSISSLLRKMVGEGEILRVSEFGVRGGYGYLLKRKGN